MTDCYVVVIRGLSRFQVNYGLAWKIKLLGY